MSRDALDARREPSAPASLALPTSRMRSPSHFRVVTRWRPGVSPVAAAMAALLLGAAACPGRVSAQPSTGAVTARDASPRDSVNCNPERAEIVSRDVHNFWRAYDAARRAPDSAGSGAAYRDRYIRAGFPGLADWTRSHPADQGAVVKVPVSRDWTMDRIGRA